MQSYEQEFYRRIKHDFKKYVMLTSNQIHLNEEYILHFVYNLAGYRCHKTVKYEAYTSHIIVKFDDSFYAMEAAARLNFENLGLTAVLVDDWLRDWFTYEMKYYSGTPYSLTIVDIVGSPPHNLNFLTSNILNTIFQDFGATYFMPYTAALKEPHVQVLFASMTEALAACIAFGEWYRVKSKTDTFFHRVRINPSNKEENLIKNCGGMPFEACKLDYFVRIQKEPKIQIDKDSVTTETESKTNIPSTKGIKKVRKQKRPTAQNPQLGQINPFCYGTPVLYFPIIATNACSVPPLNGQLGADFTTALLNLQQTCTTQAFIAVPNPEIEKDKGKEHRNEQKSEFLGVKSWEHSTKTVQNDSSKFSHSQLSTWTKVQGVQRRGTRVFERSRCGNLE